MSAGIQQDPDGTWTVSSSLTYLAHGFELLEVGPVKGIPTKGLAESIKAAIDGAYYAGYETADPGWEN